MLEVKGIDVFYGASQALNGMSITVGEAEVVTLMGRNGMGKTTTVHAIMGIVPPRSGIIMLGELRLDGLASHKIAQAGLGLVPEGRQIFPNLTVHENLIATAANRTAAAQPWTTERIYNMFPQLAERKASMGNLLSGGEQQMLAIGRALMTNPSLLILDEATEGLAPMIRREIWDCLARLKGEGLSILVIDKNVEDLSRLAERHYIIEKGRVVWQGVSADLNTERQTVQRFLGV
ncbi:MAG: ABC transporter ATP-binding protein [Rhodospirillaceae bacterium]|jgi:branched-chain amino acid transport system ATP-binding protein|nr:ABC transporter ATP-binding protein [Rhodospirillaceae bacterium]MBT5038347.1 ABC transporter ATP-binding protein [Rhodospirillaceae bacterium]MBT5674470.1 ABC transporter ATP-binding protein [Rhodospirillaceae bacterium]MBT5778978.1 ABC transporter ATP-binding protein [Rhodospirillaceae bacterium]MBT7293472.1 ABC transporter ATP-binding protein [Rhodospirillaceae bacterium]